MNPSKAVVLSRIFGLWVSVSSISKLVPNALPRPPQGVPIDMDVDVVFAKGVLTFHCSFKHDLRQWIEAVSEDGRVVRMDDFVVPRRDAV